MNTPIYTYLEQYAITNPLRLHMPGHKGTTAPSMLQEAIKIDLTEIPGADSLFEAESIIAESEKNATALFHTGTTVYSCNGSTLCIQTMLFLMKQENRTIIAARNVHRSFLNAAVLLDLSVKWVYPRKTDSLLSGTYEIEDFEKQLKQAQGPCSIYVTSPDYLGRMANIPGLAKLCKKYHAKLLVDNAHGAHLAFLPQSQHPIALGADFCCDSAHKMLPGLTGTAYLHSKESGLSLKIKDAMTMFATTSPSYLMLASLDYCNFILAQEKNRTHIALLQQELQAMQKRLCQSFCFVGKDAFHCTISAQKSGFLGTELEQYLADHQIIIEYADAYHVVMLFSVANTIEDIQKTEQILNNFQPKTQPISEEITLPHPKSVCSLREAALGPQEIIPVSQALGRICSAVKVPCPPAVPIAVSGEQIDQACIQTYEAYDIQTVRVRKET